MGRAVAMATSQAATHEAGDARAKADRTKVEVFGPRLCGGKRWASRQGRRLTSLGKGHLGSRGSGAARLLRRQVVSRPDT